jgi:hypothetical protein
MEFAARLGVLEVSPLILLFGRALDNLKKII